MSYRGAKRERSPSPCSPLQVVKRNKLDASKIEDDVEALLAEYRPAKHNSPSIDTFPTLPNHAASSPPSMLSRNPAFMYAGSPNVDNDEDQEMEKMIRAACPDNLEGRRCTQASCEGLQLCRSFKTNDDSPAEKIALSATTTRPLDLTFIRDEESKLAKRRHWQTGDATLLAKIHLMYDDVRRGLIKGYMSVLRNNDHEQSKPEQPRFVWKYVVTAACLHVHLATVLAQVSVRNLPNTQAGSAEAATCDQNVQGIELRILPLGASIVAGVGSSDGNGFRAHLQESLAGMHMEYVGTLRSGSMANNYHEGHSGFTISQTEDSALTAVPFQPNVILLHIGTNDLSAGRADYNERLGSLLDLLLDKLPDATILVCQLIGSKDKATNSRIKTFNKMVPRLVEQRSHKHILVVDMSSIKSDQLIDGVHPNDPGYRLMAHQFHEGIKTALRKTWINTPIEPHLMSDPNLSGRLCDGQREVQPLEPRRVKGSNICAGNLVWNPKGTVGQVVGSFYFPTISQALKVIAGYGDSIWFADMNGDGLDDVVLISGTGQIFVWLNGQANSSAPFMWNWYSQNDGQPIADGVGAKREQYRLADIDGDGKADMIIVDLDTGNMTALLNNGANAVSKPLGWLWTEVGQISPSVGGAAGVKFADVTGDGKADLIWLDEGSRMTIYRNDFGSGPATQRYWKFTKITESPVDLNAQHPQDMRFVDIDGDEKADAVWVHPSDGTLVAWLNKNATNKAGWAHSSSILDPPHDPVPGQNIMFGRIHVAYGRADYVVVDPLSNAMAVWENGCDSYAPGSRLKMGSAEGQPIHFRDFRKTRHIISLNSSKLSIDSSKLSIDSSKFSNDSSKFSNDSSKLSNDSSKLSNDSSQLKSYYDLVHCWRCHPWCFFWAPKDYTTHQQTSTTFFCIRNTEWRQS
ncbi:MAG: hypothetical protein Q9209_001217 [Squamulea sp. 1 TL-2023]